MLSYTFTPFRLGPVSQVFLWGSLLHNTSVFPFLSAKKPFTLHDFPPQEISYQPSEPWIPDPCDAPKLRRLTGNIHLNGWGSAAVGPQTQQITVFCQAGPENFGHHDHGFSEGPWWKLVGCSHKSARTKHPCQVEDVSILLPGNANQ